MFKNIDMEKMVGTLKPHLERTDVIGYAAARNTRILENELQEYVQRRDELVLKYGEEKKDEDGNPTGSVSLNFDSPKFTEFVEELEKFAVLEHEPPIMKLKYEQAIGILSGAELLELDWMFEDEKDGAGE